MGTHALTKTIIGFVTALMAALGSYQSVPNTTPEKVTTAPISSVSQAPLVSPLNPPVCPPAPTTHPIPTKTPSTSTGGSSSSDGAGKIGRKHGSRDKQGSRGNTHSAKVSVQPLPIQRPRRPQARRTKPPVRQPRHHPSRKPVAALQRRRALAELPRHRQVGAHQGLAKLYRTAQIWYASPLAIG